MNGFLRLPIFVLACSVLAVAADNSIASTWAARDIALDTNPASRFWSGARPVYMDVDSQPVDRQESVFPVLLPI
jgi:hypothetical protein